MIFYDYKSGLTQQQSVERLCAAFGDDAPSCTTVFEWFAEFRRGRHSLDDEICSGRPVEATTEENVAAVRTIVEEDGRMTVAQLEVAIGISSGSIRNILHKLRLHKVCARWVPHQLTEEQKVA